MDIGGGVGDGCGGSFSGGKKHELVAFKKY